MLALPAKSQTSLSWTAPQTIPGLVESGIYPVLLSDSEGNIHVFHSQPVGENTSIFYSRWSLEKGWSLLVDIITSPHGDARVFGAVLDQKGWIHILFWGGDEIRAEMYHTKAPIIYADNATAWTDPILVGESALDPPAAVLVMGKDDSLTVIYSSSLRGNGLYMTESNDAGITWDNPEPFFLTYSSRLWPSALDTFSDADGNIFAVWAVGDEFGNGLAVYFSKRNMYDRQWSLPIIIAEAIVFEADTPSIVKVQDELFLIYHNNFPTTRWMQTSSDDGQTWSSPIRLFEQVGSNGAASIVIDSNNFLHMLFGNRLDVTATHGAWHSIWSGDRWSNPEAIISGPLVAMGPNGEEGFSPSFMQAAIIRGNLLFVIWRHDPVAGPQNIWYTYKILEAPELPYLPLPKISATTPTNTIAQTETQTSTLTTSPIPTNNQQQFLNPTPTPEKQLYNSSANILIGIIPIILLLFFVVIVKIQRK